MPIRKVKGGYKIDNVAGVSKTRAAAEKRLQAIKANQASKGKLPKRGQRAKTSKKKTKKK